MHMNNMIQMLLNQRLSQIPKNLMGQMEQQLKRVNPQAFQEFQKARQSNMNPQEYLNQITGKFSPEQKQQWDTMMNTFMNKNK